MSMVSTSQVGPPPPVRARRSAAETREHVLAVAHELFYWQGIRGTGVDRVAAEAGVAPTTLYRLFASKDDLVAAYLERADRGYRDWVTAATGEAAGPPRERILALFDELAELVQPQRCRGCPFLMALAEYPDPRSPVHVAAVATKTWVRDRLRVLVRQLLGDRSAGESDALADRLALVLEGVYASVQALGDRGPAAEARALAATLLDTAGRSPR
jgi:AcrR family transcriptional regulator